MRSRSFFRQNAVKRAILVGAATAILAAPLAMNLLATSSAFAQPTIQATQDAPEKIAERRAEQALPRKAVPFDPPQFDKYVGYYALSPVAVFTVHRDGNHFYARLTGQQDLEVFPESESKFFYTVVSAQISFDMDASGKVNDLVLHQNGLEQRSPRIDEPTAKKLEAALAERIKNHTPSPGAEAALRFHLQGLESGKPDLSNMTPSLAARTKPQLPDMLATIQSLGPIQSIAFKTVGPGGADVYEAQFAHGTMEWRIAPLNADGQIEGIEARREYSLEHPVDIGSGRHLNIVCTGQGSPTVVFMQGLGGNITDWRDVREPVAAFTHACFYDRAGFGYSAPSDKASTAINVADDLHALLRAAGIKGRVVLVGHSLGGLFATLYADKFESNVAGLVLVDPSFSGQFDYKLSKQDKEVRRRDGDQFVNLMRACNKLAQAGSLSESDSHDCFHPQPNLTLKETEYVTRQFYLPSYYASMVSEFENFASDKGGVFVDDEQERRLKRSFGNLPLEVLTAGLGFKDATFSEPGKKAVEDAWRRGHDKLALRSTRGESIVIPDSGHFIQLVKPERVVEAIRKVVSETRQ